MKTFHGYRCFAQLRPLPACEELADSRYRDALKRRAFTNREVALEMPSETNSGRYWYHLHVVLVAEARYRMSSEMAEKISAACRIPSVAKCSVMPDHLHLAVKAVRR